MKQDILEQLVEDYLQARGYFTRANLKFRPTEIIPGDDARKDAVSSDIDVIGFHPGKRDPEAVVVVTCKSWQRGFSAKYWRDKISSRSTTKVAGKEAWKHFRELADARWAGSFLSAIEGATGRRRFTYLTAVTRLSDPKERKAWENNAVFARHLERNPIQLKTLAEMLREVFKSLGTSVESSQFSRTLQLIKAAGIRLENTEEPRVDDSDEEPSDSE